MSIHNVSDRAASTRPAKGLRELADVRLNGRHQHLLDQAALANGGDASWRGRKLAEASDLLKLAQIAPPGRLDVGELDLRQNLRALLRMQVPVPCRPDPNNQIHVVPFAVLGFVYPREVLRECLPGASFVQILRPRAVWHAQVHPDTQSLCLGDRVPRNIPARELVLWTYNALAMTTWQVNERDEAGVFNPGAARWWAANLDRLPLSHTPFLKPDDVAL